MQKLLKMVALVAVFSLAISPIDTYPQSNNPKDIVGRALGRTIKAFTLEKIDMNGIQGAAASGRPFSLPATKKGGGKGNKTIQVRALDDANTQRTVSGIDQDNREVKDRKRANIRGFVGNVVGSRSSEVSLFTAPASKFMAAAIQDNEGLSFIESLDEILAAKGVSVRDRQAVAAQANTIAYNAADLILDQPISDNDSLQPPAESLLGATMLGSRDASAAVELFNQPGPCKVERKVIVADQAYQNLYPWPLWYNRLYTMFWNSPFGLRHTFMEHQHAFCVDHRPPSDGNLIWRTVGWNLSADPNSALNKASSVHQSVLVGKYGTKMASEWWAGNGLSGSTIGIAWVSTVGTKWAVSVVSGKCTASSQTMCSLGNGMQVAQHEEGHTHGGSHTSSTLTGAPIHPEMSGYNRLATYINPSNGIPFFCRHEYTGTSTPANQMEANCRTFRSLISSRL